MDPRTRYAQLLTRRHFLLQSTLGTIAFSQLLDSAPAAPNRRQNPLAPRPPHHRPRAKHVIYIHMAGSPTQLDLFDYKPELVKHHMQPCPEELLKGQRFAFIKGRPKLLGTPHKFRPRGKCGMVVSDLWEHWGEVVDDVCLIRSMTTDQFNHAPAQLLLYTGVPRFGGASMGSWITWGLGSENENLPGFVVLISGGTDPSGGKSLWGSSFLPGVYQGVQCRTTGEPILFVNNPKGMSRSLRGRTIQALERLNRRELELFGDPETLTRIRQFELAYRMQLAVPEVMDLSKEPQHVLDMYGARPGQGLFANNCLLARRLVEQGVRYVQLFDWGWDHHGTGKGNDIVHGLPGKVKQVDKPLAALIRDLKQRGLLEETLVVFSGEFGRTSMNEERNGSKYLGRDHHPHAFSIWMAGGGVKGGLSYGATDELGYFVVENKATVRDLQATILHLLGLNPYRLSFPYQGLQQRLIGPTNEARVLKDLFA